MNELSILLLKDGGLWTAQCLEYDIAAQGSDIHEAISEFHKTLAFEVAYSHERGLPPLHGIPAAPQYYWKVFEESGEPIMPRSKPSPFRLEGLDLPDAYMIPKMRELRAV